MSKQEITQTEKPIDRQISEKKNDLPKLPATLKLEKSLSKPAYRKLLDSVTIIFFIFVIMGPVAYIFSNTFLNIPVINNKVFHDALIGNLQWRLITKALGYSFGIAAIAVVIGIIIAFPTAIILTRYNFKGKRILDALMDLPMAVPTSALGLSVLLFWAIFGITPGFVLIILAHIVFTFPYILRNIKIVLEKANTLYEDAARTLGASGFTVFRTITLPMMKEGLIAGSILAYTRSLGETGATIIVSGLINTAPLLIVGMRQQLQLPSASFLASILILTALILLFSIKFFSRKVGFPVRRVWPRLERKLSAKPLKISRDAVAMILVGIVVIVPTLFIFTQLFGGGLKADLFGPDKKWAYLYTSFNYSIQIAAISVLINLLFGLPMAFIITKRKWGKMITILDTLLDIPIAIPSAALGFAVFLFWGPAGLGLFEPGFWMIVFVHVTFTFPYMVRPIIGVLETSIKGEEEAARTLGASNMTVFRKITFPMIKQGVIAGGIMVFTRSLGETGATIVVMGNVRTIPVLIVNWVEANAFPSAIFASVLIIVFSAALLLLLRYITKGRDTDTKY